MALETIDLTLKERLHAWTKSRGIDLLGKRDLGWINAEDPNAISKGGVKNAPTPKEQGEEAARLLQFERPHNPALAEGFKKLATHDVRALPSDIAVEITATIDWKTRDLIGKLMRCPGVQVKFREEV